MQAITGNSIVPLDPKGKMKKIPGSLCDVLFLVCNDEWQCLKLEAGKECTRFRVMARGREHMQEVEKKVRLQCCHFRRRGGAKIMDGRTDDTQCMAPVLCLCPISGFFPSDKTSRAPPKRLDQIYMDYYMRPGKWKN